MGRVSRIRAAGSARPSAPQRWDLRGAIGATRADTAILEGQFDFGGDTMPSLASRIVAAADDLYGAAVAGQVEAAFDARGIL